MSPFCFGPSNQGLRALAASGRSWLCGQAPRGARSGQVAGRGHHHVGFSLKTREEIAKGPDKFHQAFDMLFSGANHGKLVLQVAAD